MGQKAKKDMLYRNILILHGASLALGPLEGPVYLLGDVHLAALPAGTGYFRQLICLGLHRRLKAGDGHAHCGQQLRNEALFVLHQSQKQMGLFNLLVAVFQGDVLSPLDGGQRFLGKLVHVHDNTPFMERPAVWL